MRRRPEGRWRVVQSRLTDAWIAIPPGGTPWGDGAFFLSWIEAFEHAFDQATHALSLHEVP
jgi:hypothetical protein